MTARFAIAMAAWLGITAGLAGAADGPSAEPARARRGPNTDKEPFGPFSIERGNRFLEDVSVDWTRGRRCGTCHTNYAHMIAGPGLGAAPSAGMREVRAFFEDRAANWDRPGPGNRPIGPGEVLANASALALNDAATTGRLAPATRAVLDRIWTTQRADGSWAWFDCDYPPLEDDDFYAVTLAAVAVGHAPDEYRDTPAARAGLAKLRGHLKATPAPNLHHRAMLLWASERLDGLIEPAEKDRTVADLLALRRPDGGWALSTLGRWERFDGSANPPDAPSDGYGTGFVVLALRASGMPADAGPTRGGIAWLKSHQRASGRWFTRSPTLDQTHYLTHAGTGFALMALAACGERADPDPPAPPGPAPAATDAR